MGPKLCMRTQAMVLLALCSQGFCWLYWGNGLTSVVQPGFLLVLLGIATYCTCNLNWEIVSTKYESEMNLGNNKQNNFAVEFISLNYSIMYLSFLFLNLSTNLSRLLSDSLSFPSMDISFHFKYLIDKSIGLDNRLCLYKSSPIHTNSS